MRKFARFRARIGSPPKSVSLPEAMSKCAKNRFTSFAHISGAVIGDDRQDREKIQMLHEQFGSDQLWCVVTD